MIDDDVNVHVGVYQIKENDAANRSISKKFFMFIDVCHGPIFLMV